MEGSRHATDLAEFAEVIGGFCAKSEAIALDEEERINGTADKRGWDREKRQAALFKARADEGDRVKKGVERLGKPAKQTDAYDEWRAALQERIRVLYGISRAIRRQDIRDATNLQSRLRIIELDSDSASQRLGVDECTTRPLTFTPVGS